MTRKKTKKIEYYPEDMENKFILGTLITDMFLDIIDQELSHISQNEIMENLGIPLCKIDINDVVIYDTKALKKRLANIDRSDIYTAVEQMLMNTNFGNREFA